MRLRILSLLVLALSAPLFAAQNEEFYDSAFRAGIAAFDAGKYDEALTRLHVAAFGFVEDVARYETAQAYMALAAQRLGRTDEATAALRRIVSAERLDHRFATISISPAVREAVGEAAKTLLTPQLAAALLNPPPQPQIAAPMPIPPPNDELTVPPAALLDMGSRSLQTGDLANARAAFSNLAGLPDVPRATLLKAAEGLSRARDFERAVGAFERTVPFAKGEETYRYFYAVALYETGRYRDAKRELAAALPGIKQTADVKRYKAKIANAHD